MWRWSHMSSALPELLSMPQSPCQNKQRRAQTQPPERAAFIGEEQCDLSRVCIPVWPKPTESEVCTCLSGSALVLAILPPSYMQPRASCLLGKYATPKPTQPFTDIFNHACLITRKRVGPLSPHIKASQGCLCLEEVILPFALWNAVWPQAAGWLLLQTGNFDLELKREKPNDERPQ